MKTRILVVEDEQIVQLDLQNQLERLGYTVVGVASRGEEAVALAAELHPDLVLMDIHLAGAMNGLEAARLIRAKQATPVLYLTAYAAAFAEAEREQIPGPCLSKPFQTRELRSAIARVLVSH